MAVSIRLFQADDISFLTQMLYDALYVPEGEPAFSPDIIHLPEIRKYVDAFGEKAGDLCLIAEVEGSPVGAAWCRLMHGYGYVDNETPELSLAVSQEWRGNGIGTRLVLGLCDRLAQKGFSQVSISCDDRNPAMRLYRRLGFQFVTPMEGHSKTMVKYLV